MSSINNNSKSSTLQNQGNIQSSVGGSSTRQGNTTTQASLGSQFKPNLNILKNKIVSLATADKEIDEIRGAFIKFFKDFFETKKGETCLPYYSIHSKGLSLLKIQFVADKYAESFYSSIKINIDAQKREIIYFTTLHYLNGSPIRAETLGMKRVLSRLFARINCAIKFGNFLIDEDSGLLYFKMFQLMNDEQFRQLHEMEEIRQIFRTNYYSITSTLATHIYKILYVANLLPERVACALDKHNTEIPIIISSSDLFNALLKNYKNFENKIWEDRYSDYSKEINQNQRKVFVENISIEPFDQTQGSATALTKSFTKSNRDASSTSSTAPTGNTITTKSNKTQVAQTSTTISQLDKTRTGQTSYLIFERKKINIIVNGIFEASASKEMNICTFHLRIINFEKSDETGLDFREYFIYKYCLKDEKSNTISFACEKTPLTTGSNEDSLFLVERSYTNGTIKEAFDSFEEKTGLSMSFRLALHIARALKTIHDNKLVYLFLNPETVLVDVNWVAKLSDFRHAWVIALNERLNKAIGEKHKFNRDSVINIDLADRSPNSPFQEFKQWEQFLAPEILKPKIKGQEPNFKADIFSFGAMLYFLIFKEIPSCYYQTGGKYKYRLTITEKDKLMWGPKHLIKLVLVLIRECLSKNPEHRPDIGKIIVMLNEFTGFLDKLNTVKLKSN